MKRKLTFLLAAVMLLMGLSLRAQIRTEVTDVLTRESTGVTSTTYSSWEGVSSNSDAVYAGQSAGGNNSIQLRSNNNNSGIITTASGGTVTNVTVTWNSATATGRTLNIYGKNSAYTSPTELYNSSTQGTLIGTIVCGTSTSLDISDSYTFIGMRSASGAMYIEEIDITWTTSGGGTPTVATPTFSPASGTYYDTQSVSISCTTEGATIHYTTNGTEPTESSATYYNPLDINETTTVKAKAFKSGYTASNVATAIYTFPTLLSIAEAKALAVNEYALVQGVVTFIDNRNVYIQDATGGICLFLNSGTVPSGLAIGNEVRAYGKRADYNGLFELSSINGGNANEFSILSTGNMLPLVVKTIAEINADGANTLQCTRVKIENATIGSINTTGNTSLTQGENSINIYKIPTLTDITEGDIVDAIGVVGYYNVPQIRVALASDVILHIELNPELTVSVNQLNDFSYTYNNGPSAPKSFTVSGTELSANITLTAPESYEIALSATGSYDDSFELSQSSGIVAETTIYIRLKSGLEVGTYEGNLTLVSGDQSQTVALSGSVTEQPATLAPTFSPAAGSFITAQTVSMSCETEGAVIYYTTDGTDPTESSSIYSTPLEVNQTTTIKAFAVAPTYANSSITSATYTIHEAVSIAAARALANNQYACVEGTVTYMEGRNVYIQDATGGIDLYLNSNTVPSSLNLGDNVRTYGKKTTYNGLVELTGIAGNNANVFTVISTGNELPLATYTIAEINADYSESNLLQATRVKVENAIIGTINPSGTTVISQEGNSMNVYHIPTVAGMIQGDWVTITGVIGCYNAPQLLVASADDIQFTHRPTLTANTTSLSGFTYDYDEGGPSEVQSFLLTGNYLMGRVEIYPSENFEISTFTGDNFRPENPAFIYIPSSGHFSNISINVRLKASLETGTYNEQVYVVSEYADTVFVNVVGTVTNGTPTPPEPPTPGDGNYVRISDLNNLTEGSLVVFAARFDGNATDYYAMSNQSSGKPTGVLFSSTTSDTDEILPTSIVDDESNYYWTVGVTANGYTFTNALGELIGYGSGGTDFVTGGEKTEWNIVVGTAGESAMVPGYTGFYITNATTTGRGFALNSTHNYGAYAVSNNNGSGYNFYLDLFVKTEGGNPPTPTLATPTFTPASGTYYEAQTVSIACTTEGATIYYSTTSENGPWTIYTSTLAIEETTTFWAYAEKEGYNNSNVAEATYTIQLGFVTIFNQDWEGEMNGWTFIDVEGEAQWSVAQYSGNHYAYANGYNHGANEDWCISPAFNIDAYENPILSFRTAKKYDGDTLKVYFSNNYDGVNPNTAGTIWQPLPSYNLSQGNYNWVGSGNISLNDYSGTNCYIGFKYTCEASQASAWEVDDILLLGQTSEPVVTVSPLALTGFTYIEGNGPSDEQSFTVSGLNLNNNITISNAAHYEISLTSGTNFNAQSTITLAPVASNVEETTIYVRLMAGLAVGDYNDEDITVSCSDVTNIDVNCNGSVTAQPVPGDDYARIYNASQLVAGNRVILAARYNEVTDVYQAIGNTVSSGGLGTTEFTSTMNGNDEIIPASILADEDSYYWTVDVTSDGYTFTNANGDVIGYGSSGTNFVMNSENTVWTIESGVSDTASMVPEYEGFLIANHTTNTRAFAIRFYNEDYICKAYSTSNINNANASEYNFFLDIFMQGEGGVPPTPTVAAPTFNPAGGTYYEAQEVTLSCSTPDATIYYSLVPEPYEWIEYEGPIAVDSSMTICAYASKEGYNDSPVVCEEYIIQDDIVIIFWQEWEDDWDPWHGWTEVCEVGDSLWRVASYGGNHYAYANGYNHPETIDWLISPAFDLDSYSDVVLTFNTAKNYNGPELEVYFSNDYDGQNPGIATWQQLECELSQGGWNWTPSGEISLDDFSGSNCYIGFRYYCTNEEAAGWEVDDIKLVSGSATPVPTLIATPNYLGGFSYVVGNGPSESQSYILSGVNLLDEGYITIISCSNYEISLNDTLFTGVLQFPCTELPKPIYVRMMEGLEPHTYDQTYIANEYSDDNNNYAAVVVNLSGVVHYENEPMMNALMPLYIQGNNGSNNNRVPMAVPVQLMNLEPNTTYRYTNQLVDGNDGPETAGAGNVIYANPEGFYRSTSPSLGTEGGYGEFTTDDEGSALVWLINEPTANPRFTPGNHVFMRVRLNDGASGVNVLYTFTSEDYATVLNFGNENDEYSGSAFYVKSNEAPMSFAFMYTDFESARPAYATSIETVGVDYVSINQYADFYKDLVAGNDGWFGGILPNDNESGITYILTTSMDAQTIHEYVSEDGQWAPEANTVNPTNGIDEPIFIDLTDDGVDDVVVSNVKVWNANNEFVIENDEDCNFAMNVVNVMGQTVMSCEIEANTTQRIAHHLASGIYVINLQNSRNSIAVKVLVR